MQKGVWIGSILAALAKIAEDVGLADGINTRLLPCADLASMADGGLQIPRKEAGHDGLLLALKTSHDELKRRIFENMSERAAQTLR